MKTLPGSLSSNSEPFSRTRSAPYLKKLNWAALQTPSTKALFLTEAQDSNIAPTDGSIDCAWTTWKETLRSVAENCVPRVTMVPRQPWISQASMDLVDKRLQARSRGDWSLEKSLRKQVQKSVKKDRTKWLNKLAAEGTGNLYKNSDEAVNLARLA